MTFTVDVNVDNDDWTALTAGGVDFLAQLKTSGPVLIQIAQSKPSASSQAGHMLDSEGPASIYYGVEGVDAGDAPYGRSLQAGETNTLSMTIEGADAV